MLSFNLSQDVSYLKIRQDFFLNVLETLISPSKFGETVTEKPFDVEIVALISNLVAYLFT